MTTDPSVDRSRRVRAEPYERYAGVYDQIGQRSFGERIATATLSYLEATGRRPCTAVDLACGTGAATLIFAAAGIGITGVDRSGPMLAVARRSFADAGLTADWIEQDIRSVALDRSADLVTCFYDSLNYIIEPPELLHVFRNVRQLLTPNGVFLFDLNTREKFAAAWSNSCYVAVDRERLFGVYQSWFEPETDLSPLILTFFVADAEGQWERFDEEHVERAYGLNDVAMMLAATGFEVEAMLDYSDRASRFGSEGNEQSHRVVFIAKPADAARSFNDQ